MATKFAEMVGEGLRSCKEMGLIYLQAEANVRGVTSPPRDATSTTKKETVMLPNFSSNKTTA